MFRQMARMLQQYWLGDEGPSVLNLHPALLSWAREMAWAWRSDPNIGPEHHEFRLRPQMMRALTWPADEVLGLASRVASALDYEEGNSSPIRDNEELQSLLAWYGKADPPTWDHLVYAYMIENTRIYEIIGQVIKQFSQGEGLGVPSDASRSWLRSTEELLYYDTPPHQVSSLISHLRPDIRASRRNAYYRMFGMDLNHGTENGRPYPYEKSPAANREFVTVFEDLLREVWRAIENAGNTSGPNPTDDLVLINLCRTLANMLTSRRINGNLAREEFVFVSTMSWLHLTVEYDSPIVLDLRAQATSPAERLRQIGERVGVPSHAKSDSYFVLADAMSRILILLEDRRFEKPGGSRTLYASLGEDGGPNPVRGDMATIITHWSAATGRPMKAPRTEVALASNGARMVGSTPAPTPAVQVGSPQ